LDGLTGRSVGLAVANHYVSLSSRSSISSSLVRLQQSILRSAHACSSKSVFTLHQPAKLAAAAADDVPARTALLTRQHRWDVFTPRPSVLSA